MARRTGVNVEKLFSSLLTKWQNKLECLTLPMEQHALRSVNNCLNTNIYSYLETSGDQSSNLYLNVAHFFNTSDDKTSVAA
jgi:hypothetical protein